jgi:cell division septal protein FtsQ
MRDYKNVKVPRSYRSSSNRKRVKRIAVGRGAGQSRTMGRGIKEVALKIIVVVLIAAVCWATWQAYKTLLHAEMFQIEGVDIKGAQHVSETELRKIAGVFTGQNIFSADLAGSIERARENPWVKDVRINRRLPNRISMVVTERKAFAVLDTGAKKYVMDSDGLVISRIAGKDASAWQLPIVAIKNRRVRTGEQVASEGAVAALTLLAEIDERGGWQLQDMKIKAASPESISVLYADHEFKLGTGNYPEKLRRLAEIMADGTQRGLEIASVDLRPERQAAVTLK